MPSFDPLVQIRNAAAKGNTRAQFELAVWLEENSDEPSVLTQAAEWYQRAAEAGHTSALNNFILFYLWSAPIVEVPSALFAMLKEQAEAGDREAQNTVGLAHFYGHIVDQDFTAARHWYERAARSGSDRAQFKVGGLYFEGSGVDRDYGQAWYWYSLAADQANELALLQLASMSQKGIGRTQDIDIALTLYTCALNRGSMRAAVHLGTLYAMGREIPPNPLLAYELLELSLDLRDSLDSPPQDSYRRSTFYWLGKLSEEHPTLSQAAPLHWYQRGAAIGCDSCQAAVSRIRAARVSRQRTRHVRTKV